LRISEEVWGKNESELEMVLKNEGDQEKVTGHKGKAIPLQAWTGPEGSRRLRLPDFKTVST